MGIVTSIQSQVTPPSPADQATAKIQRLLENATLALVAAYAGIRETVYANPNGLTSDQVYAAFQSAAPYGLTAEQLGQVAKIVKGLCNLVDANSITDDVPAATFTFPAST